MYCNLFYRVVLSLGMKHRFSMLFRGDYSMDTVELEREETRLARKPRRPEAAPPVRAEPEATKSTEPDEPIWFAHW